MNTTLIYIAVILIWGTTWIAIKYQVGNVDPLASVIYRYAIASIVLLIFSYLKKSDYKFSKKDHIFLILQGILLFGINYWFVYISEIYITSGLVAVTYATLMFMNVFNGYLFLKTPIKISMLTGAVAGVAGVGLIFWPEISGFDFSQKKIFALSLAFISVYFASLGNIISARNQKKRMPVTQANAYAMTYGTIAMIIIAFCIGTKFTILNTPGYLGSLIYLAFFGSIAGFGLYFTLLGRIGADKAAYAIILVPVVALLISTFFEGYIWTLSSIIGLVLVLSGNVILIKKK